MTDVTPVRWPQAGELDAAWDAVRGHLPPTPVVPTPLLDEAVLKLETAQPTGSFKVRGALAAMSALEADERVVTASAGNHGLGVAFAAQALDRDATVVVPETASPVKVAALADWPVALVQHGTGVEAAERYALQLARDEGRYVSAYNDAAVIAGQASIAREVVSQVRGPVTLVCGVGGGGLCAGLSLYAADRTDLDVVGVEVEASRAVSAAIGAGRVVRVPVDTTLADGLAGNIDDPCITPAIIGRYATGIVAVTEGEVATAIRWLFGNHGLVVEGAAAAGVAAVLADKVSLPAGRTAVVVLSGRNITPESYCQVLADA